MGRIRWGGLVEGIFKENFIESQFFNKFLEQSIPKGLQIIENGLMLEWCSIKGERVVLKHVTINVYYRDRLLRR